MTGEPKDQEEAEETEVVDKEDLFYWSLGEDIMLFMCLFWSV